MKKALIITLIILGIILVLVLALWGMVYLLWNGSFDSLYICEIATYESPDGQYILIFEQVGSPGWPFGPVDVRLTLRTSRGVYIDRISATVYNDGTNAHTGNIESIQWGETAITVILNRGEAHNQGFIFMLK